MQAVAEFNKLALCPTIYWIWHHDWTKACCTFFFCLILLQSKFSCFWLISMLFQSLRTYETRSSR